MATPVLLMGKSGSGKSASLRNVEGKWFLINVTNKPLPFRKKENIVEMDSDDYLLIREQMVKAYDNGYKSIVLDDAGYLMTSKFMSGHRNLKGNAVFELYNEIGDNFYSLIRFIADDLPNDLIVYIVMHEDINDFGDIKPKSIGKMLDDKVCIEGLFSIVLRSQIKESKYGFATRSTGVDVTKTPIGMFENDFIENDLQIVDNKIREYYKGA